MTMPQSLAHRLLRPETLTALGIMAAASALLIPTTALRPVSALLPATMLAGLFLLALLLLIADQRKAARGEAARKLTTAPRRVFAAFVLILAYALSVDFLGFYLSTALSIPLVAYAFGYRNPRGLGLATLIAVSAIYLVFSLAMAQEFPIGRIWSL